MGKCHRRQVGSKVRLDQLGSLTSDRIKNIIIIINNNNNNNNNNK